MKHFNPQAEIGPSVLASDLDGTLIPLPEYSENQTSLAELGQHLSQSGTTLLYATGRHFESVVGAMEEHKLPVPDWIICNVGTSIYQRHNSSFSIFSAYEEHLSDKTGGTDRAAVEQLLEGISELQMQSPEQQQRFKISYQSGPEDIEHFVEKANKRLETAGLPYKCMGSLDPFLNCGLLDVLPSSVSKAYALLWLSTHADFAPDEVVYSGDSGNDLAALVSGFRAIVVSNHSKGLKDKVTDALMPRGLLDRVYFAQKTATSGVLEGCLHHGLFEGT